MSQDSKSGLQKQLGPTQVWALAFGCIIGWGAFINPGKKFLPNSGLFGATVAYRLHKAGKEEDVIFGGRLAEYRYYDMAPVIERAMGVAIDTL